MTSSSAPDSRLLNLPGELRNRIYRATFDEGADVTLSSNVFPEPAVLAVCKEIRSEASPIFYSERVFKIDCSEYDWISWMAYAVKASSVRLEYSVKLRHHRFGSSNPSWRNFLTALRWNHKYPCYFAVDSKASGKAPHRSIGCELMRAMITTVMKLQDVPWSRVEEILEGYHKALVSVDPRWA